MFSQTATVSPISPVSLNVSPTVSSITTVSLNVSPTVSPITTVSSIATASPTLSPVAPTVNNSTILYNISDENARIIFAIILGAFLVNLICSITWYRKYKYEKAKNNLPMKFPNNPLHSAVRNIFT